MTRAFRFWLMTSIVMLGLAAACSGTDEADTAVCDYTNQTAVTLDLGGNFTFTNLATGPYQLIVSGPEFEIQVSELTIA